MINDSFLGNIQNTASYNRVCVTGSSNTGSTSWASCRRWHI